MLSAPEDAISTYNEILGQDADNVPSLRALDRLYVQGGQWQDLGDNYAYEFFSALGLRDSGGAVRTSIYHYTTEEDVARLLDVLNG